MQTFTIYLKFSVGFLIWLFIFSACFEEKPTFGDADEVTITDENIIDFAKEIVKSKRLLNIERYEITINKKNNKVIVEFYPPKSSQLMPGGGAEVIFKKVNNKYKFIEIYFTQ